MSQPIVPVEVVRTPKGPRLVRRLAEALIFALLTSVLTAFFLALWAPNIAAYVSLLRPNCADPRGLAEVPHEELSVEAESADKELYPASAVLDGRVANIWVPPLLEPAERPAWMSSRPDFGVVDKSASSLKITVDPAANIQLVCVVNGLSNSYANYVNWGRVRTVQAWARESEDAKMLSVLESLDEGSFQTFQEVRVPRGVTDQIVIQVQDLYEGQQTVSVDPDVCGTREKVGEGPQNDPVGCNLNATPLAGIAEVKVYKLTESRWKALWPF